MAITKGAKKAHRASLRKRRYNDARKLALKSTQKNILNLLKEKKVAEARAELPKAYKAIDKAVKTNLLKPNTGARKKSRLTLAINKAK